MSLKECSSCGLKAHTIEHLSLFKKDTKSSYGRRNKCKSCFNNERRKGRYTKEKQYPQNKVNKIKAIAYKGSKCCRCGIRYDGTNASIFDFHHLSPTTKEGNPSTLMKVSWSRVKTEIDKCILLCSNCHRLEHSSGW